MFFYCFLRLKIKLEVILKKLNIQKNFKGLYQLSVTSSIYLENKKCSSRLSFTSSCM